MTKIFLSTLAVAGILSGSALAADMPVKAAPVAVQRCAADQFRGGYIGLNGGAVNWTANRTDLDEVLVDSASYVQKSWAGMVGGQAIDLEAAGTGAAFDADGLRTMHARKTGALIRASAAAGAVMAGADAAQLAAIERFASELGLAFQIVDDILDVEGASEALGKTAGKDAASGKPTYPALYGLERSRRMAAECVDRALAALAGDVRLGGQLPAIARWVIARTN